MANLSAILYVVNQDGQRVDRPKADGSMPPGYLALGAGLAATSSDVGGLRKITISIDMDTLPVGPIGEYDEAAIIRTLANVEMRYGESETLAGRWVSGSPSQALDWRITSTGFEWYEANATTGNVSRSARAPVALSLDDPTVTTFDALVASVSASNVIGVVLPVVSIGRGAEVTIHVDSAGTVDVTASGSDTIMGSGAPYSQAADSCAIYRRTYGGDWKRWLAA